MSQKRETGRPVGWTTADRMGRYYRYANADAIEENERLECSAPACDRNRSDRSRYCQKHAKRLRDAGDPICRLPKRKELEDLRKRFETFIKELPEDKQRELDVAIRTATRRHLQKPEGWAAGYYAIHARQPPKAKAAIILANLTKNSEDLKILIVRAALLHGWARIRFNGIPENRARFIETQAGKPAIRKSKLVGRRSRLSQPEMGAKPRSANNEIAWKNVSGTVARSLGRRIILAANDTYATLGKDLDALCDLWLHRGKRSSLPPS